MLQRLTPSLLAAAAATILIGSPAIAAAAALSAAPSPEQFQDTDHEVVDILARLSGTRATPEGASPALTWRSAPVRVDGLANTVYFEVARASLPASPYRQGVMQVFRRQGELRLRVFDLVGEPGLRSALVGLWAAPDAYPALPLESLHPTHDLVLARDGDGAWLARTPFPYPATQGGAVEMTGELALLPAGELVAADRGFDAAGAQAWGPAPDRAPRFVPTPAPVAVDRRPSGLVVIDLVPRDPELPALQPGGSIAAHYTGWLTSGATVDDSRSDNRPPLRTRIPGTGVAGIDQGLLGMAPGTRRRLVIPPELGFGDGGSARGRIPPGATLIYDFEALEVQNPAASPPTGDRERPAPPSSADD